MMGSQPRGSAGRAGGWQDDGNSGLAMLERAVRDAIVREGFAAKSPTVASKMTSRPRRQKSLTRKRSHYQTFLAASTDTWVAMAPYRLVAASQLGW